MRRFVLSLLLAAAAAACAPAPDRVGIAITSAQAAAATMAAADQVQGCYRMPRVPAVGRRIATRLRVRFAPDGTLAAAPELVRQEGVTPRNQLYAPAMAEAAEAAVERCAPLRLPAASYRGGWDDFYLDFSPRAMV
jgi:hypothetical protein